MYVRVTTKHATEEWWRESFREIAEGATDWAIEPGGVLVLKSPTGEKLAALAPHAWDFVGFVFEK